MLVELYAIALGSANQLKAKVECRGRHSSNSTRIISLHEKPILALS